MSKVKNLFLDLKLKKLLKNNSGSLISKNKIHKSETLFSKIKWSSISVFNFTKSQKKVPKNSVRQNEFYIQRLSKRNRDLNNELKMLNFLWNESEKKKHEFISIIQTTKKKINQSNESDLEFIDK